MSEGASLGEAVLDLRARVDKLEDDLEKAKKPVETKVDQLQKVFSAILSSAILSNIVKAYNQVVAAAEEAAVTEAKVAGVLRATGNAAGFTVSQLSDMADEHARLTGVDDELIMNAEAVLLTFRKVGRDVFPEATKAALDMSAVMGQDLQSSIVQIGKALNDPIAGISALSRVGVQFTEDQKKMIQGFIAQNDVVSAQKIILQELQDEFGGTAQAMEEASTGSNRLKVAFGNLQEEIGKNFLPSQRAVNIALAESIEREIDAGQATDKHAYYIELAKQKLREQTGEVNISVMAASRLAAQLENNDRVNLNMANSYTAMAAKVQNFSSALAEEAMNYKGLLDLTLNLSSATARFKEQQEGVRSKQAEIKTEIDNLIAQGYTPLSQKVVDLQTKYDALGLEYDINAQKHKAATDKILFDLFMQKLSVDGITSAEYAMALKVGEATGVIDAESAKQALAFDKIAQAVADGTLSVEDMQKAIDMLQDKTVTLTVNQIINRLSVQDGILLSGSDSRGDHISGISGTGAGFSGYRAGGGPVSAGEGYIVGEDGPEWFEPGLDGAIIPNISNVSMSAPSGMGGGGSVTLVQFTYQPFIGVNDEYEAEQKLRGIVERINRKGSNQ